MGDFVVTWYSSNAVGESISNMLAFHRKFGKRSDFMTFVLDHSIGMSRQSATRLIWPCISTASKSSKASPSLDNIVKPARDAWYLTPCNAIPHQSIPHSNHAIAHPLSLSTSRKAELIRSQRASLNITFPQSEWGNIVLAILFGK